MTLARPLAVAIAFLALAAAGCGDSGSGGSGGQAGSTEPKAAAPDAKRTVRWPAPPDPLRRTVAAGLNPARKEFLIHHVHAHLDVFVDGKPIVVPAGIGINIGDPKVKTFKDPGGAVSYGGITLCSTPCISPLHTHDATGILHTESKTAKPNTLGQFLTEWGVRFDKPGTAFYVDGKPYRQDPRAIELTDHREIAIVIGKPPAQIPKTADFTGA